MNNYVGVLLFGTFGNVMTVIILRRLRSGWSAMNVYLTALALSDTGVLYNAAWFYPCGHGRFWVTMSTPVT